MAEVKQRALVWESYEDQKKVRRSISAISHAFFAMISNISPFFFLHCRFNFSRGAHSRTFRAFFATPAGLSA
jgi:hypothetical protein